MRILRRSNIFVRTLLWSFSAVILVTIGFGTYYIFEIQEARKDTISFIDAAKETYGEELLLNNLSIERKDMLLAIEDPNFFNHKGVDLSTPGAGWTTITQGLVKLLYFPEGFQPGFKKIRQTLIAQYALDDLVSKEQQLELYLNIVYLGHVNGEGINGYSEASKVYFDKEFKRLNDDEFLSLVAMTIGPNAFKPFSSSNVDRVDRIKDYLSGKYRPAGVFDIQYEGNDSLGVDARILLTILRLLTDAKPKG